MVEMLSDTWGWRDLPVLVAIAERIDRGEWVGHGELVSATGLTDQEVRSAVHALEARGLVPRVQHLANGDAQFIHEISGAAYRLTGLHRDRHEAIAALTELLEETANRATDPVEKSKLRRLAEAVGDVGSQTVANFLGTVIARMSGVG
jgi:DNA-binding MarR family transcriptional regulator